MFIEVTCLSLIPLLQRTSKVFSFAFRGILIFKKNWNGFQNVFYDKTSSNHEMHSAVNSSDLQQKWALIWKWNNGRRNDAFSKCWRLSYTGKDVNVGFYTNNLNFVFYKLSPGIPVAFHCKKKSICLIIIHCTIITKYFSFINI